MTDTPQSAQKAKKFVLKEATRKRCKIIELDDKSRKRFVPLNLELYSYLYESSNVNFSLYFRVANEMVEFIKPNEISEELLSKMWVATQKENTDVEICILKADQPKFEAIIDQIRNAKIKRLLQNEPALDTKTLEVYSTLSAASQMIVKGGINKSVANRARSATSMMMTSQLQSDAAASTLARMINCDPTLYDHSASVAMFAGVIATQYIPKPVDQMTGQLIAECGLYHDAGKTCVPNHILNKPGRFTDGEFEVMKTHTTLGHEELRLAIEHGAPIEEIVARVALEHHERFCGHGYPHGKVGKEEEDPDNGIHFYTRIVSVADVYSALLMKRVYKEAMTSPEALEIMQKMAPKDFDPEIFEPFAQGVIRSNASYKKRAAELEKSKVRIIGEDESFSEALQDFKKSV